MGSHEYCDMSGNHLRIDEDGLWFNRELSFFTAVELSASICNGCHEVCNSAWRHLQWINVPDFCPMLLEHVVNQRREP